ncbi:MAG: AMP-binding protein [bacterium]
MKEYPTMEYLSSQNIKNVQEELLQETINYTYKYSPYYERLFNSYNILPSKIKRLEDLVQIPPTTKYDLQKNNEDFLCVDKEKVVEIVCSSGTTGEPIFIALTKNDIYRLARNEELSFLCTNTTSEDLFQLMVTSDNMFIAGMAYYLGITKIGAGVIRMGPGNTKRQIRILEALKPTGIVSVPSYLIKMHEEIINLSIDISKLSLNKAVLIGESILNESLKLNPLGQKIRNLWNIELFSTYGTTEIATSFCECIVHQGLHSHPELLYFEILDENNNVLNDGEMGELTVTTFQTEGMPLIRYKTGDITFKISSPCKCGRTTEKIGPILSRKHHLIKFKGTTVYQTQIEMALLKFDEIKNYVIEVSTKDNLSDWIVVKVGVSNFSPLLEERIKDEIKAYARVTPEIQMFTPSEVEKFLFTEGSRKPKKFVDLRK